VLSPVAGDLSGKPDIQSSKASDYITHVYRKDDRLVLFLNLSKALSVEDFQVLSKQAKTGQKEAA
jgi:chemotaxis signal transduction protein